MTQQTRFPKRPENFIRVLALLFCFLGSFAPRDSWAGETAVEMALNWKPEPQFGGFYAAQLSGAFTKQGLTMTIHPGGAGTPVVQMVASGKIDFGIASADEVVLSRANGSDVVALFAVYQTNPQAIMVHAERSFKTLNDVFTHAGTLAWQKGLPYAQFLDQKMKAESISVKVERVPYVGGISNFLNDANFSQQCFATSEPLSAERAKAKAKTFLIADSGFNPYTTVLITRSSLVKKNQALVAKVVAAVRDGWVNYLQYPEIANKQMHKLNPAMDNSTFALSAGAQRPLIMTDETRAHGLGWMSRMRWEELSRQLKSLGLTTKEPSPDSMFLIL